MIQTEEKGIRIPIRGQQGWYPLSSQKCLQQFEIWTESSGCFKAPEGDSIAAIVPHAGWRYSGDLAFHTLKNLSFGESPELIILLGVDHSGYLSLGEISTFGAWASPFGDCQSWGGMVPDSLLNPELFSLGNRSHLSEHSLEVQIPFIKYFFPKTPILAVSIPPITSIAHQCGVALSKKFGGQKMKMVATTDLTHYGDPYRFTPFGTGNEAWRKVFEEHDEKFLAQIERVKGEKLIENSLRDQNACGSGPVATLLTMLEGKGRPMRTGHTSSFAGYLENPGPCPDHFVNYAGYLFQLAK